MVGTFQGLRIQLDDQSKKCPLGRRYGSIKTGLDSVRSIGYDLVSITSSNPRSAILHSKNQSQSTKTDVTENIIGLNSFDQHVPDSSSVSPDSSMKTKLVIDNLARLALAEQELSNMENRNKSNKDQTGSDLIMHSITESIIAESFNNHVKQSSQSHQEDQSRDKGQTLQK